tara:strand:- start:1262 stop:1534 length:273 start_codon:yes stop_codon:yes gene_type:complete
MVVVGSLVMKTIHVREITDNVAKVFVKYGVNQTIREIHHIQAQTHTHAVLLFLLMEHVGHVVIAAVYQTEVVRGNLHQNANHVAMVMIPA